MRITVLALLSVMFLDIMNQGLAINIHMPFLIAVAAALIGIVLVFLLWRTDAIRAMDR